MPNQINSVDKCIAKIVPEERYIFARNFRLARTEARLSQRAIEERTGLAQPWICKVENGKSCITIDSMVRLARSVDKPLWQLLIPPL